MSNKKLAVLGILAVLMVVWAVIQARSNRQKTEPTGPIYLIQGLDPTDITSIVIGSSDGSFTLKRKNGGFVVADRDNFPAVTEKINQLITTCLEIKTLELRTDNAANHKELGVTEETASSFVKFYKADSSLITGAIVGKEGPRPPTAYVRLAASDKVYLVERSPWIQTGPIEYVDPKIVAVDKENVESVSVISPEGEYTIAADEMGKGIVFQNIPPGKRLKGSDHELAFDALWDLTFDDVFRVGKKNLNFDRRFICRLKDSTVFALEIARLDGRTYLTCEADFTDEIPAMEANLSEGLLKERQDKLQGQARAKEFTAKHAGWVYRLYEYKAARFLYNLSDLLEDEE